MTLTKATIPMCPECGAEIKSGAWTCPHCGGECGHPDYGYRDESAELRERLAHVGALLHAESAGRNRALMRVGRLETRLKAIAKEARLMPANTRGSIELRDRLLELAEGRDG